MMSERELQRIQVLSEVTNHRRTVASAAAVLALSTRQVHRLLKAHRLGGAGAIAHKARGRPSNNRLAAALRDQAVGLVRSAYADFGPTLVAEMLAQKHGLKVSRETLRGWMIEAGLWLSRQHGLGEGELVGLTAGVLEPAQAAIAGEGRRDEAGLALVALPHRRIHRAQGGIGVDLDLPVLVALALDPALALLDLGRQPGHVQVVQGLEPALDVDAGPHGRRRAEQDAHPAGVELGEQALPGGTGRVVLHEGDLGRPARPAGRARPGSSDRR